MSPRKPCHLSQLVTTATARKLLMLFGVLLKMCPGYCHHRAQQQDSSWAQGYMTPVGSTPPYLINGRLGAEAEGYSSCPGAPELGYGGWGPQNPDSLPWSGIVGSVLGLGRSASQPAWGTVARGFPVAVGGGEASLLCPLPFPSPILSSHLPLGLAQGSRNHPGRGPIWSFLVEPASQSPSRPFCFLQPISRAGLL